MADPKLTGGGGRNSTNDPVYEYKKILKNVLENRPSGTRQRLAEAIGKNRSFISQISNPSYPTPIPAIHVDRILELCHFSAGERETFLAAYRRAHPGRRRHGESRAKTRKIELSVPDFGNASMNRAYDRSVAEMVQSLSRLMKSAVSGPSGENQPAINAIEGDEK